MVQNNVNLLRPIQGGPFATMTKLVATCVLAGCSAPQSHRVPKHADVQFHRVVVVFTPGLGLRGRVETLLAENLRRAGFSAVESIVVLQSLPPGSTDDELRQAFEAAGVDSVLSLTIPSTGQDTWGNVRTRLMTLSGETVWTFNDSSGGTNSGDLGPYLRAFCDSLTAAIAREHLLRPVGGGS